MIETLFICPDWNAFHLSTSHSRYQSALCRSSLPTGIWTLCCLLHKHCLDLVRTSTTWVLLVKILWSKDFDTYCIGLTSCAICRTLFDGFSLVSHTIRRKLRFFFFGSLLTCFAISVSIPHITKRKKKWIIAKGRNFSRFFRRIFSLWRKFEVSSSPNFAPSKIIFLLTQAKKFSTFSEDILGNSSGLE